MTKSVIAPRAETNGGRLACQSRSVKPEQTGTARLNTSGVSCPECRA